MPLTRVRHGRVMLRVNPERPAVFYSPSSGAQRIRAPHFDDEEKQKRFVLVKNEPIPLAELVAEAVFGPSENPPTHIDGDWRNCASTNLARSDMGPVSKKKTTKKRSGHGNLSTRG